MATTKTKCWLGSKLLNVKRARYTLRHVTLPILFNLLRVAKNVKHLNFTL